MEIFKLLGSIFVDNKEAIKSINKAAKEAENGTAFFRKLGDAAMAVGKAAAVGTAAAGAAFATLTTGAVKSYAEYEQLVGGVETLFKDSSGTVKQYAENAYKTAGMSANQYMETITSFSASLLQGLGGDTAKAAEIGNLAVEDMADNSNKFGTAVESIQNAYQGFAKGTFAMLDNLKLGYGGTAAEMARLVNDSGVLGDSFKATADNVKDIPFHQLVEAIHEVQTEMDITGTTAKEASETILGSWAAMGSTWKNILTALASDDKEFLDNSMAALISTTDDFANNVTAAVTNVINNTTESLPKIFTAFESMLPLVFDTILPAMATGAIKLMTGLAQGIVDNLPMILGAAQQIALAILQGIGDAAPMIKPVTEALGFLAENFETVLAVVIPFAAGIAGLKTTLAIQGIVTAAMTSITALATAFTAAGGAAATLKLAITALGGPVGIIVGVLSALTAGIVYLWKTNENFRNAIGKIWETIKTAFVVGVNGAIGAINKLTGAIGELSMGIINIPEIKPIELSVDTSKAIAQAEDLPVDLSTKMMNAIDRTKELRTEAGEKMAEDVATGLENGSEKAGGAAGKVADKVDETLQKLKDKLKKTYDSILGITSDMFSALDTKVEMSVEDMIVNLAKNQLAVAEWADNIARLAARGIDEGLLETLREAGPQAAGRVAELVNASDKQIQMLSTLFANAGNASTAALTTAFGKKESVIEAAAELADSAIDSFDSRAEGFFSVGEKSVEVVGEGMVANTDWLKAIVGGQVDEVIKSAEDKLAELVAKAKSLGLKVSQYGTNEPGYGGSGGGSSGSKKELVYDPEIGYYTITKEESDKRSADWLAENKQQENEWRNNLSQNVDSREAAFEQERSSAKTYNVTINQVLDSAKSFAQSMLESKRDMEFAALDEVLK